MADAIIGALKSRSIDGLGSLKGTSVLLFVASLYLLFLFFLVPMFSYWNFGNYTFDLGVIENSIYNASQTGKFLSHFLAIDGVPTEYVPHNHLNIGLYFFALLYRILPRTEWMFFFQSLSLVAALIPLYKLGDLILPKAIPRWAPLLLYLFWDPIHRMNTWDFHEAPFAIPFALWAFYFIEKGRLLPAFIHMILMAIWKEDLWLNFAGMSLYAGIRTRRWSVCLPMAFLGAAVLPIHVAFFNKINAVGHRYPYLGPNLRSAVETALTKPWIFIEVAWQNRDFFLRLFLNSGGALFLFGGWSLIALIPPLAEVGLSQHWGMLSWVNHYVGNFAPPLFVATLFGWARIHRWLDGRKTGWADTLIACSIGLCLTQLAFSEPGAMRKTIERIPLATCYQEIIDMIPPGVAVVSSDPVAVHLTHRKFLVLPDPDGDITEAEWFVAHDPKLFQIIGMKGKNPAKPWVQVAEKCGYWIAKRSP